MKTTLTLVALLALTSCLYPHEKLTSPEGTYDVSATVVKTDCVGYNQTGEATFVIYPVGDFNTHLQVVGWDGVCELDNQSGYLSSYSQPCYFKNELGNEVVAQFSLDFSSDEMNGDATITTSCITEYHLIGKRE